MVRAIGIDLGTTYSCVGVFRDGKIEIIPNEDGNRTTASYVAFTPTERLVGDVAKNQVARNPKNTIFAVKRLIGRKYDDLTVQSDMKHWPFQVINDNDKPKIEVEYKNKRKIFTPEEISSMVLTKMKQIAEEYLGTTVSEAVITVPAYFNDYQRQATKDAATIAGLNVLRIINEPTAAAMAYGIDNKAKSIKTILIFDLGGGTFNISVLSLEEGVFEVKSTSGDTHLGGEDFDSRMVEYFIKEFQHLHGKDLQNDKRALRRLRTACESAKLTLSLSLEAAIEIDSLHEGIDFYSTITRQRFEEINDDLFRLTIEVVKKTLDITLPYEGSQGPPMDKSVIDEIILVGGSTRIPKLQQLLQDFFNGKQLNKSINPDQAVAYGAAIQAAILTGDKSDEIKDVLLVDVVSFSMGIETDGGVMTPLIEHNTRIPAKQTKTFSMREFPINNSQITIKVFEGEHPMTKDNHFLGSFELPIHQPTDIADIQIAFDIDANFTLFVTAEDKSSGNEQRIQITNDNKERLSKYELEQMINDTEMYEIEDQMIRDFVATKNSLESYCFNIKERINDEKFKHKIDNYDKKKILDAIKDTFRWLETDQLIKKEQLEQKFKQIQHICSPIMIKLYSDETSSGKKPEAFPSGPTSTSPFYNACRENNIDLVEFYLQTMSVEEVNRMEPNGSTALHVAAYRGYEKIVDLLLQKGASHSIINKYKNTPLDEAKTDKIKQLIRRRMNKTRFVSDSIEWIISTNDADFQAHQYLKKLETYGKDPHFDQLIIYIKQNYIEKDLQDVTDINKIKEYFDKAIKKKDPVYLITAYTAETGFYSTLNLHLAKLRLENLTDNENLSRAYYIGIIARHPKFETLSYTGKVFRGMIINNNDLKQYKIGTRILTKTFSSASKQLDIALGFLGGNPDKGDRLTTLCTYEIRNQRTALDIQHISLFQYEEEVLILPYSAFKIIDIQINKDNAPKVEIILKECEPW